VGATPDQAGITVFICANCARPGKEPTSANRARSVVPEFDWPVKTQQIIVPCTGRLQPEHVLKAFEAGSSVVSVIACQDDNCHFIEGSRRCALRVEYLRSILKDIGLGEDRLLLSYLPGSASEDLAVAANSPTSDRKAGSHKTQVAAIRDHVLGMLRDLPPNPLLQSSPGKLNGNSSRQEAAFSEDDDDE
jgi:F420-non-reducing hydrogenase iron-sulfur subunit